MKLVLGLFLLVLAAAGFILATIAIVAWHSRNFSLWRRHFSALTRIQLRALTAKRTWSAVALLAVATGLFLSAINGPMEIFWVSLALVGYVFFVCALTLSTLARMPVFAELWRSTFAKLTLLSAPIPLLFISKGYAAWWVGDLLKISAVNVPMAHLGAATFLLFLLVGCGLLVASLGFQLLFIVLTAFHPSKAPCHGRGTNLLILLLSPYRSADPIDRIRLRVMTRWNGRLLLLATTFICCLSGFYAATSFATSRLGTAVLSAIAFEFDAAPADRCRLGEEERTLVEQDAPVIKAIFLSSSQEKALLVSRGKNLFDPVVLKSIGSEPEKSRKLEIVRTAKCFELPGD